MTGMDKRNKMRDGMSDDERAKESYKFRDYLENGNSTLVAMKRFSRKPYSVGKE